MHHVVNMITTTVGTFHNNGNFINLKGHFPRGTCLSMLSICDDKGIKLGVLLKNVSVPEKQVVSAFNHGQSKCLFLINERNVPH